MNRVRVRPPPYRELVERPEDTDEALAKVHWERWWNRENSCVSDVFKGQSHSLMCCGTCGFTSRSFEPFEDLGLHLSRTAQTAASTPRITDLLHSYVQPETLSGGESWRCPKCAVPRTSTKTLSVYRAPRILVLVLKRFNYSLVRRAKIDTPVVVRGGGEEGALHRGPYMTPSLPRETREAAVYDLIATLNHMGSFYAGHYTADCRVGKEWYNFNDETVRKTEPVGFSARKEPYVLFYEKRKGR